MRSISPHTCSTALSASCAPAISSTIDAGATWNVPIIYDGLESPLPEILYNNCALALHNDNAKASIDNITLLIFESI